MRRSSTSFVLLAMLLAAPAAAQHAMATDEGMPAGWMMRLDRAEAGVDQVGFRVMEPGYHVTTGRAGAAIFWNPMAAVEGDEYSVSATFHLFDPRDHAESFGLFIGGENLGADDQHYTYFLVRQTGEFLVKWRMGDETETLQGWTRADAVPEAPAGERGPTPYYLRVEVENDEVAFLVNNEPVWTGPADDVNTRGMAGLRVNHMLDLHIEDFSVTSM